MRGKANAVMRTTHTYAILEVSAPVYEEIRAALEAAGHDHAFIEESLIDMHGIAIQKPAGDEHRKSEAP
jgi:hypothetical protein